MQDVSSTQLIKLMADVKYVFLIARSRLQRSCVCETQQNADAAVECRWATTTANHHQPPLDAICHGYASGRERMAFVWATKRPQQQERPPTQHTTAPPPAPRCCCSMLCLVRRRAARAARAHALLLLR